MKIVLCGGGDIVNGDLEEVDRKVIQDSNNRNIFVLDISTNDSTKISLYKKFLLEYFPKLGGEKLIFFSDIQENEIGKALDESGVVYLPGGDPLILLENILKFKLDKYFNNFKGTLLGNSAGALILSKTLIVSKDDNFKETITKPGLGLLPFSLEVHYDGHQDSELNNLNLIEPLYVIPEKSFIIVSESGLIFGPKASKWESKSL
jgi:dipeptidase E